MEDITQTDKEVKQNSFYDQIEAFKRNRLLISGYKDGFSQAELARMYKVSPQRVWQIINKAKKRGEI